VVKNHRLYNFTLVGVFQLDPTWITSDGKRSQEAFKFFIIPGLTATIPHNHKVPGTKNNLVPI
jgi:hypothetical protein